MSPGRISTVLAQELGHPLYAANLEAVSAQGCFGIEARSNPAMQMRTNGIIFEGGHLWGPWVLAEANIREIEGRTFYAIKKSDHQYDSAPVLAYITSLRNKAMDDGIAKADAEDDPNAADADAKREKRPRYARCGAVPSVLEITIPQMECDGNVVGTANYGTRSPSYRPRTAKR